MKTIKRIHFPLQFSGKRSSDMIKQFADANGEFEEIHLIMRCSGGASDDAIELVELIEKSKSKVIAVADDRCDSAASIVFLSCHQRIITSETTMVIHPQKVYLDYEEYNKFLEWAKFFKDVRKEYIKIYRKRTLLSKKRIEKLCTCEEYCFNADEMIRFGMADKMIQPIFSDWGE